MKWRLHSEAGWIVSHAWSFRFLVLAAVLSGAEAALPLFMDHPPLPRRLFAVAVFLVTACAAVARLIVQERPPALFAPEPATPPAAAPVAAPAAPVEAPK